MNKSDGKVLRIKIWFLRTNESIDADQVRGYATNHGQHLEGLFGIILGFSVPNGF